MKFLSAQNLKKWRGKVCLLRIDLNIEAASPAGALAKAGGSLDAFRVDAVVPTIELLVKNGITVVLLSHRGRPTQSTKNKVQGTKLSLKPFAQLLSRKTHAKVEFVPHFRFAEIEKTVRVAKQGTVFLLENLRLLPGEEKNSRELARRLAGLGDVYVNDAFAVSHRANASVVALAKLRPAYAGLVFERELQILGAVRNRHPHPFTIIVGGAKISDKIGVLDTLGKNADHVLVAGGPANVFFMAQGLPVGNSLVDADSIPFAKKNLSNPKVMLPVDVKIGDRKILDVGERTLDAWREIIKHSRSVIWSGPVGLYEKKGFEMGTRALWRMLFKNSRAVTVVGGGETTASLKALLRDEEKTPKNIFVSTGGGAMLEFLSGKKLPGIEALK